MVYFENGQAGKAIIDGKHTGWLKIKEVDNSLFATVDVNDLIVVPEANKEIILKVNQGFVGKHGADAIIKVLTNAQNCVLRGSHDNFSIEVECMDGKTRKIPYDLCKEFINMFRNKTGKIVKVSKNTVKNQVGQTFESVYVSIDLNEMPEVIIPVGTPVINEDPIEFEESDAI